ncbi:MAG: hypothetical protein ACJAU6_002203 [Alphaproteobacteria bacterium]|jgi:hypothetical protein
MLKSPKDLEKVLSSVEGERRKFVKQLVAASAFAVPLTLVASLDGSPIREAHAQGTTSVSTPPNTTSASSASNVPEPSTLALLGSGAVLLAYMRKRGLKDSECPSEDLMGRMNWLSGALS